MTDTVTAVARRPQIGYDTFTDLPVPAVVEIARCGGGQLAVVFDGDLDDTQVAAVKARMESVDDADQAARAALAGDRDALASTPLPETLEDVIALVDQLRTAVVDGLSYLLGDQ